MSRVKQGHCFFVYDPEGNGFETFATAEAAKNYAQEILAEERSNAYDGWNEDRIATLCWGEIKGKVVETSRQEVPAGVTVDDDGVGSDGEDYSDIPESCDALVEYDLQPVMEVPKVEAQLAKVEEALQQLGFAWCAKHCDGDDHTDECNRARTILSTTLSDKAPIHTKKSLF